MTVLAKLSEDSLETRDLRGQPEYRRVDQFHRRRPERDDRGHRRQRRPDPVESAHGERAHGRDRLEVEFERREHRERPLRAHEEIREPGAGPSQTVERVARHMPGHIGNPPRQLIRLPRMERPQVRFHLARSRPASTGGGASGVAGELGAPAVGEHRLDAADVLDHVPVPHRPRPGAVVARHAAQRRAARRGHVDREEEPVRPQERVQPVQHDARLDHHPPSGRIEVQHAVQGAARVGDDPAPDRLAALRRPGPAHDDRRIVFTGDLDHPPHVLRRLREHDPQRTHLVDRRIRAVQPAREAVEADFPPQPRPKSSFEPRLWPRVESGPVPLRTGAVVRDWAGHEPSCIGESPDLTRASRTKEPP